MYKKVKYRVNTDLCHFFLFQKRREQKVMEHECDLTSRINNGKTRFMGGGFNLLAVPQKYIGSQS
jgi:hypothetical protein